MMAGSLIVILLLFDFVLGLQSACMPPPPIECKINPGFKIFNPLDIWNDHETCMHPPSVVSNFSHECQIFSHLGSWDDRGSCEAANAAWPKSESELIQTVAHAVKNNQKIRVVGWLSHSISKLACVGKQGLVISTQNYNSVIAINKTAMTITVQSGAMMNDVIEAAAKEGLALPAMIYFTGVSAAGIISTGAHGSSLSGRGSGVYEYVVGMKLVVPAPPSQGYAKLITLGDSDLKAAKISLGTLGAISEITFMLQPMFKCSFSASVKDDNDLEKEADSFLRASEYAYINWFPSHGKAIFLTNHVVSVDVPGDGLKNGVGSPTTASSVETTAYQYDKIQANEDVDAMCNVIDLLISSATKGFGFLNDGKQFTGYPVIGFNHRMQASGGCQGSDPNYQDNHNSCTPTKILDKNNTVCSWDRRLHNTLFFDVGLRVSTFNLHEAIQDIKKIRDLNPSSLCDRGIFGGIYMRSVKKSDAYLGPAEDQVTLELQTYRPREAGVPKWNEDVFQEIEQMVIEKHRGVLHWGKAGGHLFEGVAKWAVDLEKFLEVKDRFDPSGVFSNYWTDALFGIGGKRVEELRDGCALDKMCKCREDRHCAPDKGYLCREGKIWNKARVCRKTSQ
ncbi:L-gulonolactone oxidase 2 isoform X2 [Cryptomeria japonica]|uniref:L-gulonolactone oxidase 2 isoform X2 n=1 Tax=Cryptomeria japonica TaxID=3369 RepID=UPI0027DA1E0E|nr:L-gulonolactone oxidase 2 isoform X2 [Cryptomeria japonica]